MAISDSQKVDYLFKKLGFGVTKTDTTAFKEAFNESIASPLLLRGENIWQQAGSIPATIPSASTSLVTVYKDSPGSWTATVQCTEDVTASDNRTWKTNSVDWISTEFGSTYQVKVYIDTTGATTPQTTGTQIFAAGSGNSDEWFFDYQSGVLHFIGTNIPSAITTGVTGKSIFISGARYVGAKGPTFPAGITVGNLTISGNNITSSSGNVTIAANLFVTGNTTLAGYSDITIFDSIINLHTQANLAAWTTNDGKDIGIKMHYYDGQDAHAGLVRANDTGFLEWYARGIEGYGNVFQGNAYGTIKTGELLLSNSTSSTSTSTGALRVLGGVGIEGNVFVGNILTNGYCYANGNPFTSYTNSDVAAYLPTHTGNIGAGNITVTSNIYGNIKTDYISSLNNTITVFTGNTAVGVPVGNTSTRPSGQNGLIRFNTDLPSIEYFDGTIWVPITNTVTDQQIIPDGTSTTYSLDQQATTIGVIVSINGIIQRPTTAYIVNTNQITFTEIPEATDIIDIRFLGAAVTINSTLADDLVISGNLTVNGNIVNTNNFYTYGNTQVAAYLVANPQGSTYSNANVATYLPTYSGNIAANISKNGYTWNFGTTGNLTLPETGYLQVGSGIVAGFASSPAPVISGFSSISAANLGASGNVLAGGQVIASGEIQSGTGFSTGGYLSVDGSTDLHNTTVYGNLSATGNIIQQGAYYETYGNISNSGGNLTCNFNLGSTFYATLGANVTANFTNVNAIAGTVTGATIIVDQGATAYRIANVQVNGVTQTIRWVGATAGTGTASNTDVMSFSLIHLGSGTYRVLGQISNYA